MTEQRSLMLEWYAQPRYRAFSLTHDGASADRPAILMIHGFTGSPDEMRGLATIAHASGFDVEVMLLPGHGVDIARFGEIDRDDWLRTARETWSALRASHRRAYLVGYSLGGALSIHLAANHPPEAMLLLAPLFRIADRRAFALPMVQRVLREIAPFSGLDMARPNVRRFFETSLPGIDVERPEVQEAIRTEYVLPVRLLNECRIVGREAGKRVAGIARPVTVIQGRPDGVVGHKNARWLVDHFGGPVRYHEIPGNHLIPFTAAPTWPEVSALATATFATWNAP